MPASLKIGVWFPQEGLGRYTSREAPWKRDWDERQTPSELTQWATSATWFWSQRNLPRSWLQYAANQCQRWSGRWYSVGRKLLLQLFVQSKSSIYPYPLTLPLFSTSLSAPRASVAQALLNSPKPPMGRYSLSSCLAAMSASALIKEIKECYTFKILTTGFTALLNVSKYGLQPLGGYTFRTQLSTKGLPWSSLYAPTPRFIFLGLLSLLKASVTPRMGSGGPIWTPPHQELQGHQQ